MDFNFAGKRALVTGAGKGIGREICKLLAACGAKVVALSRTQSDLDSLSAEIDGGCEAVVCDLGDAAATQAAVEGVLAAGPCSLLINNAAIAINGPFLEATTADFDQLFAVNVRSVMQVSQLIAKAMIEAGGGGAIVNVSSQASMAALPDHTLYCSAKGALDMLTKMMALELGPHSIRVNSVHPTVVMTPMGKAHWDPETHPERAGPMLARIPLGHFAESIDVAKSVVFLLSCEHAGMVHGAMLPVDGGYLVA